VRALSLHQPWASLWASGRKVHETRHWPTDYRGPLAIHAAQRFERSLPFDLEGLLDEEFGPHWGLELPRGAIVGTCMLVACMPTDAGRDAASDDDRAAGNWSLGRFAFKGAEFRLLKRPIPWIGRRNWFSVPDAILRDAA